MIAVDTDVVVRLVTNDDPVQARRAARVFEAEDVLLPKTVLLETEWVLRYSYGLARPNILGALRGLLGLARVTVEDSASVARALKWYERGLDLADALHLASSRPARSFVTFDRNLVRRAKAIAEIPVGPV